MAVVSKEDLMQIVTDLVGDRTDDDALTILENAKDTIEDFANSSDEDWKKKYEDNDKAWRERYKERFMNGTSSEDEEIENDVEEVKEEKEENSETLEDLFEKGEE